MFRTLALAVMMLLAAFAAQASEPITIDSPCIMLEDIFPGIGIKDSVYCGLDYGEEKTINRQMAMYIINKYNIQGARAGEVTFRRKGVLLTEERLKKDLSDLISIMYKEIEVEIGTIRMGRDFYFSEKDGYKIDLPKDRFGNVAISVDNGVRQFNYTVSLKAFKQIYVSKGSIKKDQDIEQLVGLERYDMSRIHGEPLDSPKGYIATHNISEGRPVTTADVMKKPDATEGTTVLIVYSQGQLNVSTTGELMEDAYEGKNVRVKNSASGKIVRGVYTDGRKVLVNPE